MERFIQQLVDWTNEEVNFVEIENASDWRHNPGKAIRHFYPRLHEMAKEHGTYGCACFTPNEYKAMALKPLHFNFYTGANIYDIHSGCRDSETFRERYGLYPYELAVEVSAKRALVFLNADPATITADEAQTLAPLIDPALGQGRLQLTFIRHSAFKRWLRLGLNTDDEGEDVYDEFFKKCLEQPLPIREAVFGNPGLRLGIHPDEERAPLYLRDVIKGRWDHIRHFESDAADQLIAMLRETKDFVERSILFNAVKELASADITMAKGGLYRMSPPQIDQQHEAVRFATKALERHTSAQPSLADADEIHSLALKAIKLTLPDIDLPPDFSWADYSALRGEGYFEPIQKDFSRALEVTSQQLDSKDSEDVAREMAEDYAKHKKAFGRYTAFRKIFEGASRFGGELLTLPISLVLKASPSAALFVSNKLRPVAENQPGAYLAHGIFKANRRHK